MLMHAGEISKEDFAAIDFPVYASPKLNGIRGIVKDSKLESKSGIAIPNSFIWAALSNRHLNGMEGEIIIGSPTDKNVKTRTQSVVMSKNRMPINMCFYVFDTWNNDRDSFEERYRDLSTTLLKKFPSNTIVLKQTLINNLEDLIKYEEETVNLGYEGIVLKNPDCLYKIGRGNLNDQACLKYKRYHDGEARIINIARSLTVPDSTAAIVVKDVKSGLIFSISSGLTKAMKRDLFKYPEVYMGKLITYGYRDISDKGVPQPGFFLDFRSEIDMTLEK